MFKGTLLRNIVPAVVLEGHRLPQDAAFQQLDKLYAGVVAALAAIQRDESDVGRQNVPGAMGFKFAVDEISSRVVDGLLWPEYPTMGTLPHPKHGNEQTEARGTN